MKTVSFQIILFCLLQLPLLSEAQSAGIRFSDNAFEEILHTAQTTGKPIFIDVYTDWCVPCKKMAEEIFPMTAIGDFYNENFINYRINAEAGKGKVIAEKYQVNSYPTYLFLNSAGELIHQGVGYNADPGIFLQLGHTAVQYAQSNYTIEDWKKRYETNRYNKAFLITYISKLDSLGMVKETESVLDQYVSLLSPAGITQTDVLFILRHLKDAQSTSFDFVKTNQEIFHRYESANDPVETVSVAFNNAIVATIINAISSGNKQKLDLATEKAKGIKYQTIRFPLSFAAFRMQYFVSAKDSIGLLQELRFFSDSTLPGLLAQVSTNNQLLYQEKMNPYLTGKSDSIKNKAHYDQLKAALSPYSDYMVLTVNNAAGKFLLYGRNRKDYEKGISLGKTSLALKKNQSDILNILAKSYYKLGKRKRAGKYQAMAINFAENEKIEAAYHKELEKMKSGEEL
ncbi:thioredoxin family protein [Chitinophaga sp.]|uniref:thioredoxin family protein n=1 Tax=Chitinophaga sp. TaxID=1869181 RepID=UPI002F921AD7